MVFIYVSSTDLAKVLGITTRRVQQLTVEGIFSKDDKTKKYYLPKCVKAYIDYKCAAQAPVDVDYEREKALHEKAKREKAELILAQMKGELHAAEDVEREMTNMITNVKTKLRGVPVRIAPSLLAQTELSVVESILLTAVDECLMDFSEYSPALFANPGYFVNGEEEDNNGTD